VLHIERVGDAETAELAVSAAESGSVVLAAIDAPTAVAALSRLTELNIGLERVGRSVLGVLAQRLVRKICTNCKELYEVPAVELRRFGFRPSEPGQQVQLARGRGCEMCRNTGYKGRMGLFELLTMNPEIADRIARCGYDERLEDVAKANGMVSLREDGLVKILEGLTCPEELMRLVPL